MRRWKFSSIWILALGFGVLGCHGGGAASTITLTISPTVASVITNTTQPFTPFISGTTDTVVTWTVTCPTGVTAPACGTIDTNGVYTAPKTIPTVTTNGTAVITPTATITGTSHADSTKTANATVTIVSGISISISPVTATVGTLETFLFTATVSNPGCDNSVASNNCQVVTWSVPTSTTTPPTDFGKIDTNTGVYTAPGTAPNPSSVTITATSVKDTAVTATASVTIVTAAPPTLTSVSPNSAGLGSAFQDVYITGTNFISTNNVYANNTLINGVGPVDALPNVSIISSSVIRARIPDSLLATAGILQLTVSQQTGGKQNCTVLAQCQMVVTPVRPAITGPSPNNIQQCAACGLTFNVNGGFFGTASSPDVSATFAGQPRTIQVANARQMSVIIGGGGPNSSDFAVPGLYPVDIYSATDATKFAATNISVQPNYATSPINSTGTLTIPVGLPSGTVAASPKDVAINPATGMAVVANSGSNDVTLIDFTASTPTTVAASVVAASICTSAVGAGTATPSTPCPASGPSSVAVDYTRNVAFVVNATSQSVAVVDLTAKAVTSVTPLFSTPPSDAAQHLPVAIGINPLSRRALVTLQNRPYGLLLDLGQTPPAVVGPVTISTSSNSRVAVDPHLNWAIATPGGLGSIGIVDLNRQTVNHITSLSRAMNVVTVTVQASTAAVPQSQLAVQLNPPDTVLIQGVSDPTFNGFYTVSGLGPGNGQFSYTQTGASLTDTTITNATGTVNYAAPVATLGLTNTVQGIGINPETQQAVLVDPSPNGISNGVVSFFSLLDQSVTSVTLRGPNNGPIETGSVAGAFNPLTNVAVTVNPMDNSLSVIDPSSPKRLTKVNPFPGGANPVAVAVDPGTNLAVVVNQANNSVSIVPLGAIQPLSITETSPKEFVVNSTLQSVAPPSAQTLTILGKGFTSTSKVRLDGNPLIPTLTGNCTNPSPCDRELTVIVPPALLTSARRFALDVQNSDGTVSNASDFTVTQSVDVSSACTSDPLPAGVAIDPVLNLAAVSLAGCGEVALIDLPTGTGAAVNVGAIPLGVAVLTRLHTAIVANNVGGSASVVDELGLSVTNTSTAGGSPVGVAANQDTGEAAIADSVGNSVTILNLASKGTRTIGAGQRPIAVAYDYQTNQIAAALSTGNSVGVGFASSSSLSAIFPVSGPTSVAYDPATNTFLAASSTNNSVTIYDPTTQQQIGFLRVGINPTAIAYNYLTGTLISTNTGSHTITIADILSNQIRAVLTLPPTPVNSTIAFTGALQFAVDIHPLTNLAVIADTANGRVLFVPMPR